MATRRRVFFVALIALIAIWTLLCFLRAFDRYPPGIGGFTSTSVTLSPLSKILYSAQSDSKESISSIIKTLRAHEANLLTRERDLDLRAANLTAVIHRSTRPTSLVSYVYTESPTNRRNLEFFIAHGLHGSADFVFTFNGETDAHLMLPIYPESPFYQKFKEKGYSLLNIEVLFRDNKCYDMGAHGSALLRTWIKETKSWRPMGGGGTGHPIIEDEETFMSRYDRFILMNASIRGPFMPVWSHDCWTEAFWSLLSKKKKLVGMTYNCYGDNPGDGKGHVQSMVWATDARGIRELMRPDHEGGIGYWCPVEMADAIKGETRATPLMLNAGYEVEALDLSYHSMHGLTPPWNDKPYAPLEKPKENAKREGNSGENENVGVRHYREWCSMNSPGDFWHENAYHGFNIHPFETIFIKAAREMHVNLLKKFTEWTDGRGCNSFNVCDGDWNARFEGERRSDINI